MSGDIAFSAFEAAVLMMSVSWEQRQIGQGMPRPGCVIAEYTPRPVGHPSGLQTWIGPSFSSGGRQTHRAR